MNSVYKLPSSLLPKKNHIFFFFFSIMSETFIWAIPQSRDLQHLSMATFGGVMVPNEEDIYTTDSNAGLLAHVFKTNSFMLSTIWSLVTSRRPTKTEKWSNYWDGTGTLTISDLISELMLPECPFSGMLTVDTTALCTLKSTSAARRQVTIIDRHSVCPSSWRSFFTETNRRLAPIMEFEPLRNAPVGRRTHFVDKRFPDVGTGNCVLAYHAATQVADALVCGRNGAQLSTVVAANRLRARAASDKSAEILATQIPDDVLCYILSMVVDRHAPLTDDSSYKFVCRRFYRCWWGVKLGAMTPRSLYFAHSRAINGLGLYSATSATLNATRQTACLMALLTRLTGATTSQEAKSMIDLASGAAKSSSVWRSPFSSSYRQRTTTANEVLGSQLPHIVDPRQVSSLDLSGHIVSCDLIDFIAAMFPVLEQLVWDRSINMTDEQLTRLLTRLPTLRRLSISHANSLRHLSSSAPLMKNLVELRVAGCPFGAPGLLLLSSHCVNVQLLDMSGVDHITDTDPQVTIPLWESIQLFTRTGIKFCQRGGFPSLHTLLAADVVLGFKFNLTGIFNFGTGASQLRCLDLSALSPYKCGIVPVDLSEMTSLEVLHINNYSYMCDPEIYRIAEAVCNMPRLRWLGLNSLRCAETFAEMMIKPLLNSSADHEPLTIVQLPHHPTTSRRPYDCDRHLVWPTIFSADAVCKEAGIRPEQAASHQESTWHIIAARQSALLISKKLIPEPSPTEDAYLTCMYEAGEVPSGFSAPASTAATALILRGVSYQDPLPLVIDVNSHRSVLSRSHRNQERLLRVSRLANGVTWPPLCERKIDMVSTDKGVSDVTSYMLEAYGTGMYNMVTLKKKK